MAERDGTLRRASERDLAPRQQPVQARAKQTVDLILNTARLLLVEVGIDSFNTNLLAERAGIAIRSVYRYYPNKHAVIVGLAERQAGEWNTIFSELIVKMGDPKESAVEVWEAVLDAYVVYLEEEKGRSAIRNSMQAIPELREVNHRANDALVNKIAGHLVERGIDRSPDRLSLVAWLLLESSDAAIDAALGRHGRVPSDILEELKLMHASYLSLYVS